MIVEILKDAETIVLERVQAFFPKVATGGATFKNISFQWLTMSAFAKVSAE